MQAEIRSKRLMMRRAQISDFTAMHAMASDFDVVRMTGSWPWPSDRNFTASRCTPMDPAVGMSGPVFRGDELVGAMGAEARGIGYMFARAHWGQGYASEMGAALLAYVWAKYDWPEITALVLEDNPASVRVLEKLGFGEGPRRAGKCVARGGEFPMRSFSLPRPAPRPAP